MYLAGAALSSAAPLGERRKREIKEIALRVDLTPLVPAHLQKQEMNMVHPKGDETYMLALGKGAVSLLTWNASGLTVSKPTTFSACSVSEGGQNKIIKKDLTHPPPLAI